MTHLPNSAASLSRMVFNPITAVIQRVMWDFSNQAQAYIEHFPHLVGRTFGEMPFYFEDAIVVGEPGILGAREALGYFLNFACVHAHGVHVLVLGGEGAEHASRVAHLFQRCPLLLSHGVG
jgi:hypothetical protein